MFERLEALETAVRRIQAFLREMPPRDGVRFGDPAPVAVPSMDDPDKAKAAYEAAQAETKNQEERGKANLKDAQDNEKRAKEVLDKSVAEAKVREQAEAKPPEPPPPPTRSAASSRGD